MRTPRLTAVLVAAALMTCSFAVPRAQGARGGQAQLPDSPGRDLVQTTCSACHGLNMITGSFGNTRDGWQTLFGTMVALPPDQAATIATYLAAHFPPKPAPQPVLIAGNTHVSIKEWLVPTLGSRPHDPLAASDGSIWWSEQYKSKVGRLDPRSGAMKEFVLKTPDSGPHGIIEDRNGMIWFTAIDKHYIGKLDPKTGSITEFPLPGGARSPHTPIFDQKGTMWFTMQSGKVGRLDPQTGEIKVVATPSQNTYPYGMAVDSKGAPWYVDFRGNRIGRVDPTTMEIQEHLLPNSDARPRRIAITPDDVIWYTDFARGYLGRFDPATGSVKEWASPGGSQSQPYGIAHIGNVLWYAETGVKPNTLVRFEPKSEKFQTWVIPSGGGVIRNMMPTRDGNIVMACSGVNRVALVEIGKS
jgi:virginiamycin B lyase